MTVDTTVTSQTRAELPPGWRIVRFSDVVRNVDVNERNPREAGIERYVGLDHLDPESLHIKRWGLVEEGTTFTRTFTAGQVLFGKRRAYQRKAAVAEFDGICSGDILVFEPSNGELIPELLPFIVQSDGFFSHALGTSAGSLSPRTKWKDLAAYEFALPPRDQQHRIAEMLWAADQIVGYWSNVIYQFDKTRTAILEPLYSNGIRHEKFKNTELDYIPEKWEVVRFAEICIDGSQNGLYKPKSAYGSGIETVHMGDLFANEVIVNGGMQRIELSEDELHSFGLRKGDLLFARRSIVLEGAGKCSIVGELSEPIAFESSIIRVSLKQEIAYPNYFVNWFQHSAGRRAIRSITRKGAIAGIAASDLMKLEIPVPPLQEQLEISNIIRDIEAKKQMCLSKQGSTFQLYRSLLKHLLAPT